MRVLVTRPEPDASRFAAAVRARGHEPVIAPLMKIEPGDPMPPISDAAALIFTSANGVRAAAAQGLAGAAFAVGEATAAEAADAGFTLLGTGAGDVASLAACIIDRQPKDGLLHVAGVDQAGDLLGLLASAGITAQRWIAYRARAVAELPGPAIAFFEGPPGAALLLSPRTALILAQLLGASRARDKSANHRALCLSAAVADAAKAVAWRAIEVAPRPDQAALLQLLARPG